ncbi:hypothetical protein H6S82_02010 [Planktothrix sp. FACHB-1355]|uniref:Uncharacterized protein n=1 Tax=Aerosakkonema funiforme FACHB-1375 TaxID=2949571 RepID=A0A926VB67_9CYAN|nr:MULTISPECIES: hypothetical protein [Oscillatoriales]MBD2180602.1 hypothetical protein [Aerosakkonema funiforme FACHB-1375]MBD3557638.1 hypothetical protein [Planktothrix sp. FACHB-1355]
MSDLFAQISLIPGGIMSHYCNSDGQLWLFPILIRQKIPSRAIRAELALKIGIKDPRTQKIKKLGQFARQNQDLELETDEGV